MSVDFPSGDQGQHPPPSQGAARGAERALSAVAAGPAARRRLRSPEPGSPAAALTALFAGVRVRNAQEQAAAQRQERSA